MAQPKQNTAAVTALLRPAQEPDIATPIAYAQPARLRPRHRALLWGFVVLVVLPVAASAIYLFGFARDQFVSNAGFTIHQEGNTSGANNGASGFSFLTGAQRDSNGDQLYAFLQSQTLVERLAARSDLRKHFEQGWPQDPLFSLWPNASIEDLTSLWHRFVRIDYDHTTRLFSIQVRAFTAEMAYALSQLVLAESQEMIDMLNAEVRQDTTELARQDVARTQERLRGARAKIAAFRADVGSLDPVQDAAGRARIINGLEQQLTTTLVDYELLDTSAPESTPSKDLRLEQLAQRIAALRKQIAAQNVTAESVSAFTPERLTQYESLQTDLSFAQDYYLSALKNLEEARQNAARRSLYLSVHIPSTKAQEALYPKAFLTLAIIAGLALLIWSTITLVYYSLRDRG